MRENTVRTLVGWIVIVGHLALVGIVIFWTSTALKPGERITILLTFGPVATAYFAAVVKSFMSTRLSFAKGRRVNMNYALVAVLIPGLFMACLAWMLISFPDGLITDAQVLQQWIAGLETALGGTVGFIIAEIFPAERSQQAEAAAPAQS
jgi:hypothetical protein